MVRRRLRWRVLTCVSVGLLCGGWVTARASLTYSNPFHPDQCEIALASGEQALVRNSQDARATEIVAEALLCRGLERDDPWALQAAIAAFRARLSSQPDDFFSQLYYAEALRRRFPLADETPVAFKRAHTTLATADVGAARAALNAYLIDALADVNSNREQFLPVLRARAASLEQGPLAPAQLIDLLTLLAQTGPRGVDHALAILDAQVSRQPDAALDTFYRAEILRGRESQGALVRLYQSAEAAVCEATRATPLNECQRSRWRLEQLEAIAEQKGGE